MRSRTRNVTAVTVRGPRQRPLLPATGAVTRCRVHGIAVALVNVDGRLHAFEDACLRCGASLADGALAASIITCRNCGWRYDVVTGCVDGLGALRITTFGVRVEGRHARIDVDGVPQRRR